MRHTEHAAVKAMFCACCDYEDRAVEKTDDSFQSCSQPRDRLAPRALSASSASSPAEAIPPYYVPTLVTRFFAYSEVLKC
ncbi:hypothetical protein EVAR_49285_1 [Eumeta japonica]|uniref:Uncharacterized protein n=1 Tax=Eumeta variegata TaxID=151549 RepID=A0A4C1XQP1_EUMVA|nr:hypothetical protein EVAR_49285_1 [Eumeta japonica]